MRVVVDWVVLSVSGDLDLATDLRLETDVQLARTTALREGRGVLVDLNQVRFCDLAGLDALHSAVNAIGGRVVLVAAETTATSPNSPRHLLGRLERIGRPQPLLIRASFAEAMRATLAS